MGDKCNCYRFSPRDSLSGAVAQIADYLSKHPGWNETELRAFVDGLISSAGVETFNGRSGNVTLNKDDVNNLLIANCYFAEADETIGSIDVLALYKLGIRIVFTQYSSELDGYTLAYGIEYYPATDTAKAYLFSSGSGGVGAIVSVNGKTGTVVLKASDILMNNGDSVEYAVSSAKAIANAAYSPDNPPPYPVNSVNSKTGSVMLKVVDVSNGDSVDDNAYIFIDETENYPDIIAPDSNKLGGQIPSYYATAESVNSLKNEKANKSIVSDAWQSGKTYAVGTYCIYKDRLYKALVQTTAEPTSNSDWTECTIADEIIAITLKNTEHKVLTTDYGSIIFFAHDKVVSFYAALENMPTTNNVEIGYVPVNPPNYDYVIFPAFNVGSPYIPVGSTWIYSNGKITLFKNDETASAYLYGTYVINN